MTRDEEARLEQDEKFRADERFRQYRRENLFWRLWGLPMEIAEQISEHVWEEPTTPSDYMQHRRPWSALLRLTAQ